jgi:ribosomal protein S6
LIFSFHFDNFTFIEFLFRIMFQEQIENDIRLVEREVTVLLKNDDVTPVQRAAENAGVVISQSQPSLVKIKLAYPIKKNNYAFLGSWRFNVHDAALQKFVSDLKFSGDVLRFMVTKIMGGVSPQKSKVSSVSSQDRLVKKRQKKASTESVLTNEAIEKKIEEIMK